MITNHHSSYVLLRYKEWITRNMTKSWYFSSSEADIFLSETWVGGTVFSQWKNMNWCVIIYLCFVGIFWIFCQKIPYCPFHFLASQLSFQLCLFSDWQGNYEILSWVFYMLSCSLPFSSYEDILCTLIFGSIFHNGTKQLFVLPALIKAINS